MLQWIQRRLEARRIQQITAPNAQARVARGADYLDEVDPGWHLRVDPDTLELASGRACVLGQLHGDFRLGLGRAHLLNLSSAPRPSLSPVAYGFRCVQNVPEAAQDRDYVFLNRAWTAEIRTRQDASAMPDACLAESALGGDDATAPAPARPDREAQRGSAAASDAEAPSEPALVSDPTGF